MKIKEAIEILEHPPFYPSTPSDEEYAVSFNLGIEALKRIDYCRKWTPVTAGNPLPGETK